MRAMILAAGRGERMRPLTDTCPKPLLKAGGKPLIVWHIERMVAAGIDDIVINTAWLGAMIEDALGDGSIWGARLHYSHETIALETAGGIAHARHFLGDAPFLLMNGDVFTDWDPRAALTAAATMQACDADMWLLLVDNPAHHPKGDFLLDAAGHVHDGAGPAPTHPAPTHPAPTRPATTGPATTGPAPASPVVTSHMVTSSTPTSSTLTYAGVAIYHPRLFSGLDPDTAAPMAPLMRQCMAAGRAIGQHYRGQWADIGTAERLATLDASLGGAGNFKQSML